MSEPRQSLETSSTVSLLKVQHLESPNDDSPITHKRTETTLVKNTSQSYEFVSVLDELYQNSFHRAQENSSSESPEEFPEKAWCPACSELKRVTIRYVAPEVSVWRRIFCNYCFGTPDCEALHCCVACKLVITKVKYTAKKDCNKA